MEAEPDLVILVMCLAVIVLGFVSQIEVNLIWNNSTLLGCYCMKQVPTTLLSTSNPPCIILALQDVIFFPHKPLY